MEDEARSFEEALKTPGTKRWSLTPVIAQQQGSLSLSNTPILQQEQAQDTAHVRLSRRFSLSKPSGSLLRRSSMPAIRDKGLPHGTSVIDPKHFGNRSPMLTSDRRRLSQWRISSPRISQIPDESDMNPERVLNFAKGDPSQASSENRSMGLGLNFAFKENPVQPAVNERRAMTSFGHLPSSIPASTSISKTLQDSDDNISYTRDATIPTISSSFPSREQLAPASPPSQNNGIPPSRSKKSIPEINMTYDPMNPFPPQQQLPMLGEVVKKPALSPRSELPSPILSYATLEHPSSSVTPAPNEVSSPDDRDVDTFAERCWANDINWVGEGIAQWLGGSSEFQQRVRQKYMGKFHLEGLSLESALRRLCSKLALRAESQQIDRILQEFSKQYAACNPSHIWESEDAVYAVSFAMLLLNTDLNTDRSEKMSRSQFVQNILVTLAYLSSRPLSADTRFIPSSSNTSDDDIHSIETKPEQWYSRLIPLLNDSYRSIRSDPLGKLSHASSTPMLRRVRTRSRTDFLAMRRSPTSLDTNVFLSKSSPIVPHTHLDEMPSIYGYLTHYDLSIKRRFRKPAPKTRWAVVYQGILYLFDTFPGSDIRSLKFDAACMQLSMVHAMADTLASENDQSGTIDLTLADGVHHHFTVADATLARQWIATIFRHAAQYSRIPMQSEGSDMDFGWSKLNQPNIYQKPKGWQLWKSWTSKTMSSSVPSLATWTPPLAPRLPSDLNTEQQSAQIVIYKTSLTEALEAHQKLFEPLKSYWESSFNAIRAQAYDNWQRRLDYLTFELKKWTIYLDAITPNADAHGPC
ncbi:hypothetical protein MPSI1_000311 [Malassezia psittaci]|uniref:SEC7 domain-containing protein n=1 Tax=Malassezia psittaci TaxID=1821823 RepID=A0AAF0F782_9BASI|nr:hypothetical protein MPSI1_000311 [Malassezia psittaci]